MLWKLSTALVAMAGITAGAVAQVTYEQGGARITFQLWNPTAGGGAGAWTSILLGTPSQRYEWRAILSYTGTRTDLFALGEALYQPIFTNTDNVDAGNGVDTIAPWRNGGVSGNSIAGSMLTEAEGNNGSPLATYGRVRFGATLATASNSNTLTTFRHNSGTDGPPLGNYTRIAGSSVSQWPRNLAGPVPPLDVTTDDLNAIARGVSTKQLSQALNPAFHVSGLSVVVFRGAFTTSNEFSFRTIGIQTFRESFLRVGGAAGASEGDDRRYISWQTGPNDSGSHRTLDPQIVPASIEFLIPAPGALGLCTLAAAYCVRRRRS